jgi:hypothetical protein
VALGELAGIDQLDRLIWEVEQADSVGEVAATAAQPARETRRCDVQFVQQRGDRPGLLTGGARYSNGAECASFANLRAQVRSPGLRAWEGVELG